MSIQRRIRLIFDKMILKDIDVIKNYKYFENEKVLVLYIDATDIDKDKYLRFNIMNESDIMDLYFDIYVEYYTEYNEDGSLIDSDFIPDSLYEEYYGWYETDEDWFLFNLSKDVAKYLKIVGLEDLKISFYINCEK